MRTDELNKKDYKFILEEHDGFSPQRNREVIEAVIRKTDEMIIKKRKEYREELGERVDAIATYFQHMQKSNKPADKYFGKRWMAHLRGEQALEKFNGNRITMDTSKLAKDILGKKLN